MDSSMEILDLGGTELFKQGHPGLWADVPERILLVDDEKGIRDSYGEFLKSLGYHVFTSQHPFQALRIVEDQFIHLVILDLHLPGMDGIELQKRIAASSPDTMIVIITGFESLDSALMTHRAGAYDYLIKPIQFSTLEMVVKNSLLRQRLQMENRHLLEELRKSCAQLREREAALEAKEAEADYYLNNILEKANDIIFTLDMDGRVTYVNPKIELLGYRRDSLIGSPFFSLLCEKEDAVSIYRSIRMGKPREWEVAFRDKEGVGRSMFISTSPIHDVYRSLAGVLGIARDITREGKPWKGRQEGSQGNAGRAGEGKEGGFSQEIRGSYAYSQEILEGIPMGVAFCTRDGRTLYANLAFLDLFSLTPDEVINRFISSYLPVPMVNVLMPVLRKAADECVAIECIEALQQEEEGGKILGARLLPILNRNGDAEHLLLFMEDVTRSRSLEKEQRRQVEFKAMLQLASSVAHEVRNPLSIILSSIHYLRSIPGEEQNVFAEHFTIMAEGCQLMESIMHELMNFVQPCSMVFTMTDVNACLERTASLFKSRCRKRNIEIQFQLDPELPLTACDEQHLGQVFINLILNAVQAMPQGGALTISTRNEPARKRIQILFLDTGIGIDREDLEQVFEPFVSKKGKGIGLGLTVSRRIIEDHHGRIWLESEKGQGTRVHIQLPYRLEKYRGKGEEGNESHG